MKARNERYQALLNALPTSLRQVAENAGELPDWLTSSLAWQSASHKAGYRAEFVNGKRVVRAALAAATGESGVGG